MKLFNCPLEETAIHTISVYASASFPGFTPLVSPPGPVGTYPTTGNDFDCSGVTTIVIPTTPITDFSLPNYFLEFSFPEGDSNTGICIAEVRFSDTNITVPTEVSSTPPLPPAFSTVLQSSSSSSVSQAILTVVESSSSHSLQLSSSSSYTSSIAGMRHLIQYSKSLCKNAISTRHLTAGNFKVCSDVLNICSCVKYGSHISQCHYTYVKSDTCFRYHNSFIAIT